MQLMVSTLKSPEEREAGFDPDFIFDGHQLEDVSYNPEFFVGYNNLPVLLDFVNADDGGVPWSPPGDDVFWPGYESGQLVIVTNPDLEIGDRFGLKEQPSIPEPATMVLLGVGSLLIIARKRKLS
jgi:hypothetical protein